MWRDDRWRGSIWRRGTSSGRVIDKVYHGAEDSTEEADVSRLVAPAATLLLVLLLVLLLEQPQPAYCPVHDGAASRDVGHAA